MKIDFRHILIAALLLGVFLIPSPASAISHRHEDDSETSDSASDDSSSSGDHEDMDSGDSDREDINKDDSDKDSSDNGNDEEDRSGPPETPPKPHAAVRAPADVPGKMPAKTPAQETPARETEAAPEQSSGNWWHPHPGTSWQIQYSGKLDTSRKVAAYDIDLVDVDPAVIKGLHERGIKAICYFSAGSYEKWRPDAREFPHSVLGKSNGWKDEQWLDIRKIDILKPIMEARIKLGAEKGCDAIDPDNVEGYDNKSGFPLTFRDQIAYNTMIADLGHANGMAVGLKNDLDQVEQLVRKFDFQVNEQCFEYHSCNDLKPFIEANKPVFNIEYNVDSLHFCPQANAMNFDSLQKKLELDAWIKACR